MGYTHYFKRLRRFTDDEWAAITEDVRRILAETHVHLRYEMDHSAPPEVSWDLIRFNGVDHGGHETFLLRRDESNGFNCCKTARKPYDQVVCAVLILVDFHAHGACDIGSDGNADDWQPGLALVRHALPADRAAAAQLTFMQEGEE